MDWSRHTTKDIEEMADRAGHIAAFGTDTEQRRMAVALQVELSAELRRRRDFAAILQRRNP